jgi:hypothetical protein
MTKIPGPYTDVDKDDKINIQGGVPETVYSATFKSRFTERGAQDRIITTLFAYFISRCDAAGIPTTFHPDNELHAIKLLKDITK